MPARLSDHRGEVAAAVDPPSDRRRAWQCRRARAAQFSYALSPVQIIVAEKRRAWYHFVTTTCAVVGGVFTVAGILDGIFHTSVRARAASDVLGSFSHMYHSWASL